MFLAVQSVQKAHLLLSGLNAALPLEEALNLLLGPMRHIVPDPIAGRADTRCLAKKGKVVQVPLEVCTQQADLN